MDDGAGSFRDRRVPNFDSRPIRTSSRCQDALQRGHRVPARGATRCSASTTSHNNLAGPSRTSARSMNGNEVYINGNPGEGIAHDDRDPAGRRRRSRRRSRSGSTTRSSSRSAAGSRTTGSAARSYVSAGSTATTPGLANSDEIRTPTTGASSATRAAAGRQHRARRAATRTARWDLDELLWDSHGNLDVLGRLATDRPHVVEALRLVQAAVRHAGRRVLLRRQRHAGQHDRERVNDDPGVRRRPRQHGPDAVPDQTDLLARTS